MQETILLQQCEHGSVRCCRFLCSPLGTQYVLNLALQDFENSIELKSEKAGLMQFIT